MGKILLFYKYVSIQYPRRILKWQRQITDDLKLRGRVILAHEGINGTVGGDDASIARYIAIMQEHELFADIDFKVSAGAANYFPRMAIKVKKEVVHLAIDPDQLTVATTAEHISPQQAHHLMDTASDDLVILDARNAYESRIGAFANAIKPPIENFRDLPKFIDQHRELFTNKQVVMYCTGGIRCERASGYLQAQGIAKKVMQIEGGIVRYVEQYPDGFFRGKNYVFDRRVTVNVTDDLLSTCDLCSASCDTYTNCLNAACNKHYIACSDCLKTFAHTCSQICARLVERGLVKTRVPFEAALEHSDH